MHKRSNWQLTKLSTSHCPPFPSFGFGVQLVRNPNPKADWFHILSQSNMKLSNNMTVTKFESLLVMITIMIVITIMTMLMVHLLARRDLSRQDEDMIGAGQVGRVHPRVVGRPQETLPGGEKEKRIITETRTRRAERFSSLFWARFKNLWEQLSSL